MRTHIFKVAQIHVAHAGHGAGVGPFGYFEDNEPLLLNNNQHQKNSAILDTNESQALDAWFSSPDAIPPPGAVFGVVFGDMAEKVDMNSYNGNFNAPTPSTNSSSTNMAGTQGGHFPNPSPSQDHMPQPVHTPNFLPPSAKNGDDDIMSSARALSSLAAGQDPSQSGSGSGTMSPDTPAASWGNMFNLNFGSAPAGYAGQPYMARHSSIPSMNMQGPQYPMHVQDWQYQNMLQHQQQQLQVMQQQQHVNGGPRARHGSYDANYISNPFSLIPHLTPTANSNGTTPVPGRPQLLHYGSDPNVRPTGYTGSDYSSYVDQKATNLNNVPLADQAAKRAEQTNSSQAAPLGVLNQRTYFNNNMSSGARQHQGSMPSPSVMGGLPFNTPLAGSHIQGNSMRKDECEDEHPRKRRKSQIELDDDEEYTPGGSMTKRKSRDDDEFATPNNIKRRKSAVGGTASPTPSDAPSPGDSAKRRSKSRANLSEQEKRQNHILSEQRRRNVIKNGYADLDILVPVLNGGKSGLSKADALKEAIIYLENTVTGNERWMQDMDITDDDVQRGAGAAGGIEAY